MSTRQNVERGPDAVEALRKAAATPIEVDVDDLQNKPAVIANGDSPSKRTRWDVTSQSVPGVKPEIAQAAGISLADLAAALAPLTDGVLEMRQRITNIENQFAIKVDKTLDMVQAIDQRQRNQGVQLQQVGDR